MLKTIVCIVGMINRMIEMILELVLVLVLALYCAHEHTGMELGIPSGYMGIIQYTEW